MIKILIFFREETPIAILDELTVFHKKSPEFLQGFVVRTRFELVTFGL